MTNGSSLAQAQINQGASMSQQFNAMDLSPSPYGSIQISEVKHGYGSTVGPSDTVQQMKVLDLNGHFRFESFCVNCLV